MATEAPHLAAAFLGNGPGDQLAVVVIAKKTYAWSPSGALLEADETQPLCEESEDEHDERGASAPTSEPDFYPFKAAADVVVKGHVHAPLGRPTTKMTARVTVGEFSKRAAVYGDRIIERGVGGRLGFSAPKEFTAVPLTYRRAYGGLDASTPWPTDAQVDELEEEDADALLKRIHDAIPSVYPRNFVGCGYIVHPSEEALCGLRLPNFEDPRNLLDIERLAVRRLEDWWRMPLPQGFGWISPEWFPRSVFLGDHPEFPGPEDDTLEEVRLAHLPRAYRALQRGVAVEDGFQWPFTNGASRGLVLPLRGDERVTLAGFSPAADEITFALPGRRPRVEVSFRGELDVRLRLHTLLIEPDHQRLSLTWCARASATTALLEALPAYALSGELPGLAIRVDDASCKLMPSGPGGENSP